MRVATWNVNSIKVRLDAVTSWLAEHKPDFLLLQEIKCKTEMFPAQHFEDLGYHCSVVGQPGYNGVATLSRKAVTLHKTSILHGDPLARIVDVVYDDLHIINIYAPNGNPVDTEKFSYKLRWLAELNAYCQELKKKRKKFLIAGDFNIIPEPIDAAHPEAWKNDALYQPESRAVWREFLNLGLTDAYRSLYPKTQAYTFWEYLAGAWQRDDGIRIDHFLLSPYFADRLKACWIDKRPRSQERPSDHTVIACDFDF